MRRAGIIGATLLVITSVLAYLAWRTFTGPLFHPGAVGALELQPPPTSGERWRVTPDVELAHIANGSGRNVLFVHGGPGIPPTASAPAFDALSDSHRFHYYDQRGTGGSTRLFDGASSDDMWTNIQDLEGTLGVAQQLADIERIRRILGDQQLVLVGHSYGALLAALYAGEFPTRVEALVLIAPADLLVFPSAHGGLFDPLRERLPAEDRPEYDAWLEEYLDLGSVFTKSTQELQALDARLIPYFVEASGAVPSAVTPPIDHTGVWHARAQFFSGGIHHDWRPALRKIDARTLIVHGSEDLQPVDVSHLYRDAIPTAEVRTVDGSGHFPHYTHPDALAAMLRAFLVGSP